MNNEIGPWGPFQSNLSLSEMRGAHARRSRQTIKYPRCVHASNAGKE
ncbi:MAG: hypothetical protein A4E63_00878 [Syntrophorhabdus sp. PtaU1.Bin050]|nr:MAG: hypothetical protein A4E63_00878 [Syntrophorhabdus sp. PtaU1.Bin050]